MKITKHSYTNDIKIGDRFGKLTTKFYDKKRHQWYCKCDCGGETYTKSSNLVLGYRKSCCCSRGLGKKICSGEKFGKLKVLDFNSHKNKWRCLCDCGKENYVASNFLKRGRIKSCGCGRIEPKLEKRRPNNESLKLLILRSYKISAKKRNIQFDLLKDFFFNIIQKPCHYCGENPNRTQKRFLEYDKNFRYNGIDRIDNNKGYIENNVVPCCFICNSAKSIMRLEQFKEWIKKVYDKQFNK